MALSLLIIVAVIYALTRYLTDLQGVWGFINAFSEAAMVGAFADWFAVTAIFRHPMGLPIPHTAIVPRKKAQLGKHLRSEEHTSELQSRFDLVCRLLLEKKKITNNITHRL